jgi:hypothetical protein
MQTQDPRPEPTGPASMLQHRLDDLRKLRDEIRVKLHLGEMDARDAFKKLEPAVDKAEHEVTHLAKDAAGAVSNAFAMTLDSLTDSLKKIRAKLPK